MKKWLEALAVYADRRLMAILFLGFSSGLPLALSASTLAAWMTEAGVDIKTIGLFALAGLPYNLKFLWAPAIDGLRLPWLAGRLGRRRGWTILTQLLLIGALLALGASDPAQAPLATASLALLVAFCSASQDIVIDAFRVEILEEDQYAAGAAMVQLGYRIGMLVAGAGALLLASFFSWFVTYAAMAALVGVGLITAFLTPEPKAPTQQASDWRGRLSDSVIGPFKDLIARQGWSLALILAFIVLYKMGDALAGVMSMPFYIKMGFSKPEIAGISKLYGTLATLLGAFLGGIVGARMGIGRGLLLCGFLQMVSNLMFAWQATVGYDLLALTLTIGVENLAGGMGSAVFVAYLSRLCNLAYTGTQYALLSALATMGRTGLAASGGFLVEALGWFDFFLVSTAAALPGLLLLIWMLKRFPETLAKPQ
jgi:PAT family beta-lactamase induction signal transducer AmpG